MAAQAPAPRVSLELLRESRVAVMKNLNLIALLPVLESRGVFSPEELRMLKDEGHSQVERVSYLLQDVYKRGQSGVDFFLQCLRDEGKHPGHQEILHILEKSAPDQPQQNRILEILDEQLETIESYINLTAFLNILTKSGVITVHAYMDITNPYRTQQENVIRFIRVIQNQGVEGLIDFIKSLQQDTATLAHQKLAKLLLDEVKKFLKTSPHRAQVSPGDKIALLQLDRGTMQVSLEQDFKRLEAKLVEGMDFQLLLPYLQKHDVLTSAEADRLKSCEPPSERSKQLISLAISKGPVTLAGLLECFKESSKHKELAKLFETPALSTTSQPLRKPAEKTEKLAVMICMDKYVELDGQYMPVTINMSKHNGQFEEYRERLKTCLERLGFKVVSFATILAHEEEEEEEEEGRANGKDFSSRIRELFQKYVVSCCGKDATVFIYISGIQFPFKLTKDRDPMRHDAYSGAVLLQGCSEISRKPLDCLRAQDLHHWVELLPTDYVTFLIDCHQSHVVAYGKLKQPKEVEIMEDAWRHLTSLYSSIVVYFVKPDLEAMGRQRGQECSKKSVFGLLTDKFTQVLMSWIRRNRPEVVSHRLFYEALSFHWHKNGREHLLFNPAVQGDVDRAFLGKSTYPYHQIFRADLTKTPSSNHDSSETFNLKEMQVATGTMAGLILGDELEVFHVLRPEVKVGGNITRATPLSAMAEIRDKDRVKFAAVLLDIYEEGNRSRDGSTEFVLVKKKFPLHQREQYAVFVEQNVGESGAETIKQYIRESSMLLSVALKEESAKMVVRMDGQFYQMDDLAHDVAAKVKVRRIQQVKSMLEMTAWFKYVKSLKQPQKAAHLHTCHMTSEKPLLKKSIPLNLEFQMRYTTHVGQYNPKEAILDFSDQPKFWIPDPQDTNPILEVEFRNNYVITGLEIRGDAQEEKYVNQASVLYRKQVLPASKKVVYEGPSKDQLTKSIDLHCQEPVRYVTFDPENWVQEEGFNVTLKMKHKKTTAQKGTTLSDIEGLTVMSWAYHQQKGTGWKFIPAPDSSGYINLGSDYHWLSWSGNSPDPVTFDLATGFLLDRIDVAAISDTGHLQRFQLHLHTQWLEKSLPPISSVWPMKHQFPQPFLASNVQLRPRSWKTEPKVQLQLYGNKHDERLVVEERELLTLHFINTSHSQLFVYLFCLEETGMIKLVFMDVVKKVDGGQTKGMEPPSFKKMIRTNIPEGYDPPSKQITDMYKVFVSPKKMYLEPFIQRGLTNYHHSCCYSVCSLGPRSDFGRDEQWYDYQFSVVVKAASRGH